MGFVNHLMIDSAKYAIDAMKPNLLPTPTESSGLSYLNTYKDKAMHGIVLTRQHTPMGVNSFNLWRRGHLSISGATNQMPGLMDFQTSSLSLHQDFGRFQLSASATANKYWMPMQSTLYTQYGSALHLTEAMPTFASATALARILVYVATSIPCRAAGPQSPSLHLI